MSPEETKPPVIERKDGGTLVDSLVNMMLNRIQEGRWPVGFTVPSERDLIEELGVSRIALREAILKLRALGVLNVSQGKRSTIAKIDASILGRLFPLMLSLEGEQNFEHVFRVRLALESDTAYLAALHRTGSDIERLDELVETMHERQHEAPQRWAEADMAFHLQIAKCTKNPMFFMLIEALSGFITHVQMEVDEAVPPERDMTQYFHRSIVDMIRKEDAEFARVQMQALLRKSASHIKRSGVLSGNNRLTSRSAEISI